MIPIFRLASSSEWTLQNCRRSCSNPLEIACNILGDLGHKPARLHRIRNWIRSLVFAVLSALITIRTKASRRSKSCSCLAMFKLAIAHLQRLEQNFYRRAALVRIVINADKTAKTDERIQFLIRCKRAGMSEISQNVAHYLERIWIRSLTIQKCPFWRRRKSKYIQIFFLSYFAII